MPIEIKSVKGYYFLDVWIMANIIQLATLEFCNRFLNKNNDPCGRQFDQMTQAARSVTANIAEGLSRHQTSRETEMKLSDVARASLSELSGDYFFLSMTCNVEPWAKNSPEFKALAAIQLDRPQYTNDWQREAWAHILRQKEKFNPWLNHNQIGICLNTLMQLCDREISMLQKLIAMQLDNFKRDGGFTENLTQERLATIQEQASTEGAPLCPQCGRPMMRRMIRKGSHTGEQFWGCTDYPNCRGTRPMK